MRDWGDFSGFTDATELLRGGVFVLLAKGKVVYVGRSSGPMLAKIANLRSSDRPKWLPKIHFDQVLIRFVHPDQVAGVVFDLIATHQPKHNAAEILPQVLTIERRI